MKKSLSFIMIPVLNLLIVFSVTLSACSVPSEKKVNDQIKSKPNNGVISKPPSSYSDTLTISSPGAIFYNSDSLQLVKTRAINKEAAYESMVHECFFMIRNAHMVLKKHWPQLKVIDTTKARYLLFIKADKSKTYIDLNTKNDMCGMLMFDGKKDPELADMTNVETALEFYFGE